MKVLLIFLILSTSLSIAQVKKSANNAGGSMGEGQVTFKNFSYKPLN